MAQQGKGGGGEEEVDAYRQQSESKTSAALKMHSEAKVAFRGAEFFAREGEREAEQAMRPNKDTPQNPPPLDHDPEATVLLTSTGSGKETDGDGDEDGSTSGSSSGGGGGMWAPPAPEDVADYIPFADVGAGVSADAMVKAQSAKPQDFTFETADGPKGQMTQSMNAAKAGQTGQAAAPAAPAAAKSGGGAGAPGLGGKTGGGGGKSGPGSGPG